MIGTLLDIGNIVFFLANFPGLITAYKNRRNLKGLSSKTLIGYMIATLFFITVGYLTGGYMTVILGFINLCIFAIEVYWKRKYKDLNIRKRE